MPPSQCHTVAPVVFLHGSPTCGALWDGVRARVTRRTAAPDLPGHGATPPLPLSHHSVDDHLSWLGRYRREAELPAWSDLHLVGTDYGALLAAELAVRHRVRSLTVVSGVLGLGWAPAKVTALPGLRIPFYRTYAGRRWMDRAAGPTHREAFVETVGGALQDTGLARRMEQTALGIPLRTTATLPLRLRRSRVPTLLVWGTEDRNYSPRQARVLSTVLGTPLRWVSGAGHALPFEQPGPLVQALVPFWRQAGDRSGADGQRGEHR